ncbi:hypothetical protein Q4561_15830 [Alteromonas sp. 1_MG-2023]|uniref:hypothetical protein n=1 Tax=Alteromonas sp. 1_MG-2023 TaxID=3062669 RepID=UPI0026E2C753|nr:hypothetical protein [Alteromonas sp. 1_MG-2023]MDO6568542.1 hypothetical protein [Alteromonas sp. 1_MG-2023]
MKPWVVIVLILFIAVTGYQFGYYHGKLAGFNVEKERLNTVLERSRTTESSNLRVIKATPQMSGEAVPPEQEVDEQDAMETASVSPVMDAPEYAEPPITEPVLTEPVLNEASSVASMSATHSLSDFEAQNEITEFLAFHPSSQKLTLNSFQCTQSECEFTGEYSGSHAGFERMLEDLKAQSWWQFGEMYEVSTVEEGSSQIGVKFSSRPVVVSGATT